MRLLGLAARNLLRNRRRSVATLVAVAVGTASMQLFGGFAANIRVSLETAYARAGGHLQIQHRDFHLFGSGNPSAFAIEQADRIVASIKASPELRDAIVVATPTLQFQGIGGNFAAGVSRTVIGFGVIAEDAARMRRWNGYGIPYELPPFALAGSAPDAAVIGVGLARALQLCAPLRIDDCPRPAAQASTSGAAMPDDLAQLGAAASQAPSDAAAAPQRSAASIEVLVSGARGAPNVASLEVVQAQGQGFKELDEIYVATHLEQARRLVYGQPLPRATAIQLQLRRGEERGAVKAQLESVLGRWSGGQPLTVLDLEALYPFYVQTLRLFDTIFAFIFALIGGVVLFSVSNTMNAAVVERTVEIGTLRAIGLRRAGIRRLFVTEGFVLGLAGAALGTVVALITAVAVNHAGLVWQPPGSAEPMPLVLRVWGEARLLLVTALGLLGVAGVSAWWPAHRGSRLPVVDALRHA